MDKTSLVDRYSGDPEQRVLLSHLYDLMLRSHDRNLLTVSDFLTERDRRAAEAMLTACGCRNALFYGGYPEAERTAALFLPEYLSEEQITAEPSLAELAFLELKVNRFEASAADLSHRDVLGALMGLGIERDVIGDIVSYGDRAVIVVREKAVPFLTEHLTKVGRYKVDVTVFERYAITPTVDYIEGSDTVASMRLDAVAAAVFSLSRSDASAAIGGGLVLLNGAPVTKADRAVGEGDKISMRGKGKVVIDRIDGRSKKGRLRFRFRKYK